MGLLKHPVNRFHKDPLQTCINTHHCSKQSNNVSDMVFCKKNIKRTLLKCLKLHLLLLLYEYINIISETAGHKMSPTSRWSPFSVSVHWRLQVSTSHLCKLNMSQGLASKLFLMSQIMLVDPPHKIVFSVRNVTLSIDEMWKQPSIIKLCTYIILYSEAQSSSCRNKKKNIWVEGDFKF